MDMNEEKTKILLNCDCFSNILLALIETKKKTNKNISQNAIAMKIGFKSRSHLSDIIAGRRTFPENKLQVICDFFSLSSQESYLLKLFHQLQYNSDSNHEELKQKICKIRSLIKTASMLQSVALQSSPLAVDVFFYFFHIKSHTSFQELQKTFSHHPVKKVEGAIQSLKESNILLQENETISLNKNFADYLKKGDEKISFKNSMSESANVVHQWYSKSSESIFGISISSCNYANLPQIKGKLTQICDEFAINLANTDDPDTVFKINVALFPLGKKN